ncbi:efflux RND transporter permease subunit [Acidocella aromatica]|uniref:Cobalt-zinc-cadmium resistance protein CzcA n=1 Tax=Acidocella aromatica TaxID=1303579 RepID=A0A840VMS5_9PROT|nr:efflux RND transporter permease subunit [Acidocella aromatica]MBB5374425.1 cobalt-zinc-cadmium resistance protein CzcA [Acidocella aromatica]
MTAALLRLLGRPALWLMIYAALLGYGLFALFNIPEEVLPAFNYPEVSVSVHLPGTTATDMEAMVATPLEGVLLGLPGVSNVRSTISDGLVETDMRFAATTSAQADLQAVNGAIERAQTSLPPGAQPFTQIMGNAINEVADYAVRIAPGASQAEVARAVAMRLVPALRAVPGVQLVTSAGLGDEALWVQPNLAAMEQAGVSVRALQQALAGQAMLVPGGFLSLGHTDSLITFGNAPSAAALAQVPVMSPHGPIPLGALARVVHSTEPVHQRELLDGEPAIALVVFKQQGASTLPVTRALAQAIKSVPLPQGVSVVRIYDQGHLVGATSDDLRRNLLIGGVLAIAGLLAVLGGGSGAWLLALSLPASLLLGIAGLYATGQSLNLLTFGAIIVALGLVADDSIIVLESIFHRWEAGDDTWPGIWRGVREIMAPDIIGTLTTMLVFVPLLFTGGLAGLFCVPFALGMIFSLGASLLVSLTLIPLGLLPRHAVRPPRTANALLIRLMGWNRRLFRLALAYPKRAVLVCVVLLLASSGAMSLVSVNVLPLPNEGVLLESFTLAPGTSLADTDALMRRLFARLAKDPAVEHVLARIGSAADSTYTEPAYAGEITIRLKPGAGGASLDAIANRVQAETQFPSLQTGIDTPTIERLGESLNGLPQPFALDLYGDDLGQMSATAQEIAHRLGRVPGLSDLFNDQGYPETQIRITPHAAALAAAGMTPAELSGEVSTLMAGQVVAELPDGAAPLPLYLRLPDPRLLSQEGLDALPVGPDSATPLGSLADISFTTSPNQFMRIDGARALEILATPTTAPDIAIVQAKRALVGLKLPLGERIVFGGLYPMLERAALGLGVAAIAAVTALVWVLFLRFSGRRVPLLLLAQIPLAMTGGGLALAASGLGLNGIGLIGFLALAGVSLNHGVVLLDRAQRNEAAGMSPEAAMDEALNVRFRPIFLTTAVAILGMLPTALGFGTGAAPERGLAVVIGGGILWSALLCTNLLPALYLAGRGGRKPETQP